MPGAVFRTEMAAGARLILPMLVGVIPFGLVAGATPATTGLGGGVSIGLSTIVFAGASQLAAAEVLADGGSALVAVVAACTINLRMMLYSASLAPYLAAVPLRRRLGIALPAHRPGLRGVDHPVDGRGRRRGGRWSARARASSTGCPSTSARG